MTLDTVRSELAARPAWSLDARRPALERTFQFPDFATAWAFMSQCALAAERLQHHPEWRNVWATVDVTLTTHDCSGISSLDFALADAMDRAAEGRLA